MTKKVGVSSGFRTKAVALGVFFCVTTIAVSDARGADAELDPSVDDDGPLKLVWSSLVFGMLALIVRNSVGAPLKMTVWPIAPPEKADRSPKAVPLFDSSAMNFGSVPGMGMWNPTR